MMFRSFCKLSQVLTVLVYLPASWGLAADPPKRRERPRLQPQTNVAFEMTTILQEFGAAIQKGVPLDQAEAARDERLTQVAAAAEDAKPVQYEPLLTIYVVLERHDDVVRVANSLLEQSAGNYRARVSLANSLYALKRPDDARKAFDELVGQDVAADDVASYLKYVPNGVKSYVGQLNADGQRAEAQQSLAAWSAQLDKVIATNETVPGFEKGPASPLGKARQTQSALQQTIAGQNPAVVDTSGAKPKAAVIPEVPIPSPAVAPAVPTRSPVATPAVAAKPQSAPTSPARPMVSSTTAASPEFSVLAALKKINEEFYAATNKAKGSSDPAYQAAVAARIGEKSKLVAQAEAAKSTEHATLATIYWDLDRYDKALGAAQAASESNPANYGAQKVLVSSLCKLNRLDEARAALHSVTGREVSSAYASEYLRQLPGSVEMVVSALLASGKPAEASQTLELWKTQLAKLEQIGADKDRLNYAKQDASRLGDQIAKIKPVGTSVASKSVTASGRPSTGQVVPTDPKPITGSPSPAQASPEGKIAQRLDKINQVHNAGIPPLQAMPRFAKPVRGQRKLSEEDQLKAKAYQEALARRNAQVQKADAEWKTALTELAAEAEAAKSTEHQPLARIYGNIDRHEDARREAQAAWEQDPTDLGMLQLLLDESLVSGHAEEALPTAWDALGRNPSNVGVYTIVLRFFADARRPDDALKTFRQWVDLKTTLADAETYLAPLKDSYRGKPVEKMAFLLAELNRFSEAEQALLTLEAKLSKLEEGNTRQPTPMHFPKLDIVRLRREAADAEMKAFINWTGPIHFSPLMNVAREHAKIIRKRSEHANRADTEEAKKAVEDRYLDELGQLTAAAEAAKSTEHDELMRIYIVLERAEDALRHARASGSANAYGMIIQIFCDQKSTDAALAAVYQWLAADLEPNDVQHFEVYLPATVSLLKEAGKFAEAEKMVKDARARLDKLVKPLAADNPWSNWADSVKPKMDVWTREMHFQAAFARGEDVLREALTSGSPEACGTVIQIFCEQKRTDDALAAVQQWLAMELRPFDMQFFERHLQGTLSLLKDVGKFSAAEKMLTDARARLDEIMKSLEPKHGWRMEGEAAQKRIDAWLKEVHIYSALARGDDVLSDVRASGSPDLCGEVIQICCKQKRTDDALAAVHLWLAMELKRSDTMNFEAHLEGTLNLLNGAGKFADAEKMLQEARARLDKLMASFGPKDEFVGEDVWRKKGKAAQERIDGWLKKVSPQVKP